MTSTDAPETAPSPAPRIIPRSEHTISRSQISPNALRVLYRLREGGYQAFLVGGCVRDLLIGMEPKDFDVATDALPEDVKRLFRNCRLIGRRFRLAHVFFGRETIEVATFRASSAPEPGDEPGPEVENEPEPADLATPAELEAELAAELDGDADDDADGGDDEEADGEVDDFTDTVTLLPDEVLKADLADDEYDAGERTAVLPRPEFGQGTVDSPAHAEAAHSEASHATEAPAGARASSEAASRSAEESDGAASGPGEASSGEDRLAADELDQADESGSSSKTVARDFGGTFSRADRRHGSRRDRRRDRFDEEADSERVLDTHGRILRDNVYGNIDDDVWRRDFTCNSLYYNIADFSLWDYVGGAEDIAARRLRLIGDPETRYREDPVRMLRAARFEAKLGFEIDPATAEPIERLRGLLTNVPPARLFDEMLKLFLTGHGERSLEVLRRRGLLEVLLPATAHYLDKHPGGLVEQLVINGLRNTDERARAGKPVTPTYLFALLLYGPIAREIESSPPQRWHELHTILEACDSAVREACRHITIPRRFSLGLREMFALQPRLEHPRGRRALRVLEHPRFRASYDLLLLRAELGLAPTEMAQWWTRIQEVSPEERARMADELAGSHGPGGAARSGTRRGPRRRRRRRSPPSAS